MILELASRASEAANAYRSALDDRLNYRETFQYANELARATNALTAAIADAVAEGDGRITPRQRIIGAAALAYRDSSAVVMNKHREQATAVLEALYRAGWVVCRWDEEMQEYTPAAAWEGRIT